MNLAIRYLKESLAKSDLSERIRRTLEKRLAELEQRRSQRSYVEKEKRFTFGRFVVDKKVSIVHPILGEVGDILVPLVNKAAGIHFKRLPKYTILEFRDIWQAGMVGALESLSRYNINKGVTLQTFLYKRVQGGILDLMRLNDHIKRTERSRVSKINKRQSKMMQELQTEFSRTYVARDMGKEYQDALAAVSLSTISLEESPMNTEDGILLINLISSDDIDPCDFMIEITRREKLWKTIKKLSEKDRIIIMMFSEGTRLKDIGNLFGFTESWACLAKKRIIEELSLEMKDY